MGTSCLRFSGCEFGEPISTWNGSLGIHVGKNGRLKALKIGGNFLQNASLQRRELVGHFGINYVRLGV